MHVLGEYNMAINFESEKEKYRINSAQRLIERYDIYDLKHKKSNYKSALKRYENNKKNYINAKGCVGEVCSNLNSALNSFNLGSSFMAESYQVSSGTTISQSKLDEVISELKACKNYFDETICPSIEQCIRGCNSLIDIINDGINKIEEAIEICKAMQETTDE